MLLLAVIFCGADNRNRKCFAKNAYSNDDPVNFMPASDVGVKFKRNIFVLPYYCRVGSSHVRPLTCEYSCCRYLL